MAFGNKDDGIRRAMFAGSFYPRDKESLFALLEDIFGNTGSKAAPMSLKARNFGQEPEPKLKALIVPHAGYIYCGRVAASGYRKIPTDAHRHYVLIGPSHRHLFSQIAGSPDTWWETPIGLVDQIPWGDQKSQVWHKDEHSLEVQLPYLQFVYAHKDFSVTCLLTGVEVDVDKSAQGLSSDFKDSFFIVSTDFSHYLPDYVARQVDGVSLGAIKKLDSEYFLESQESACGRQGVAILIELARIRNWVPQLIMYDTSAAASKDLSSVVGYACVGFYEKGL